jgi:preprotein translocase subunit SecY
MEQKISASPFLGRVIRTFIIITIARFGNYVPIPGITEVESLYESSFRGSSIYNLSTFSGGSNVISIFTLGLGPFFSASILVQFLTKLYPAFEKLQNEEGDAGRKQIIRYTRLFTILFSVVESIFLSNSLRPFVFSWTFSSYIIVALSLTSGSLALVWLSELITERGIGNGSSILILASNLSRYPDILINKTEFESSDLSYQSGTYIAYMVATLFIMLVFSSFTQEGARRIPIVSPKQLVDGSSDDTKVSYIPLRFGQAGVIPIIFSSSILLVLSSFIQKSGSFSQLTNFFAANNLNQFVYFFTFLVLIIGFSFFYTLILLSPEDIAKNLKKMSSVITNVKPGTATKIYLRKSILQASFIGSILLSILIFIPFVTAKIFAVPPFSISGITSLILSLSILNDTSRQVLAYFETRKFLLLSD